MFRIIEASKSNVGIKFPSTIELIVFKYIQYDCGGAYLFRTFYATPHGVKHEGFAQSLALHVFALDLIFFQANSLI